METYLSREILEGLGSVRSVRPRAKSPRLTVRDGKRSQPLLRLWESGFAVPAGGVALRGRVDLYDGGTHLASCLIVCAEQVGETMEYEFKQRTRVTDAPAVDYERDGEAPSALLPG
ncbi:hypothetical protein FDP22_15330 [Paroceanicella profunda]|uniref:Uncharacterized protein n=1 Tax=Paroceanicella profunda TaxID=2579971 RepID=A0A5B8FWW9_9RHOB|nr:hypothetical protein [Paroceanicella profunda]QDL93035.1 hypothetical protein FDP22_15330 [Paroceanicella profunda]